VALEVAGVHAQDHLGPVLGLDPAGAGVDLEDGATTVLRSVQQELEVEALDHGVQFLGAALDLARRLLVGLVGGEFTQQQQVLDLSLGGLHRFGPGPQLPLPAQDLVRAVLIRPEIGAVLGLLEPVQLALQVREVKDPP